MNSLSDKAKAFLAKDPTLLGVVLGHQFYEDPTYGDERSMWMITPEGKLKRTHWWDLPEAHDFPFI